MQKMPPDEYNLREPVAAIQWDGTTGTCARMLRATGYRTEEHRDGITLSPPPMPRPPGVPSLRWDVEYGVVSTLRADWGNGEREIGHGDWLVRLGSGEDVEWIVVRHRVFEALFAPRVPA